jgi:hypothetical protein
MGGFSIGYGIGIGLRTAASSAPSGIPVASTASVVISNSTYFDGTALKKTVGQRVSGDDFDQILLSSGTAYAYNLGYLQGSILLAPNSTLDRYIEFVSIPFNKWFLVNINYDTEIGAWFYSNFSENLSTDQDYIPTTGWSPSLTITAA